MKHSTIKICVMAFAVFAFATSISFAKGSDRGGRMPQRNNSGVCSCGMAGCGGMEDYPNPYGRGGMHDFHDMHGMYNMPGRGFSGNTAIMGSVKSVDSAKNVVVVTNADGKDVTIHINPNSRIYLIDKSEAGAKTETVTRGNRTMTVTRPEIKQLKISDIKKGDWLEASKYNTDTTAIEAANIRIIKE